MTNCKISPYIVPFGRNELFIQVRPGKCTIASVITKNNQIEEDKEVSEEEALIFYSEDIPNLLSSLSDTFMYFANKGNDFLQQVTPVYNGTATFVCGTSENREIVIEKRHVETKKPVSEKKSLCAFKKITEISEFAHKLQSVMFFVYGQSYKCIHNNKQFITKLINMENGAVLLKEWETLNHSTKQELLRDIFKDDSSIIEFFEWNVSTFLRLYQSYFEINMCIKEVLE